MPLALARPSSQQPHGPFRRDTRGSRDQAMPSASRASAPRRAHQVQGPEQWMLRTETWVLAPPPHQPRAHQGPGSLVALSFPLCREQGGWVWWWQLWAAWQPPPRPQAQGPRANGCSAPEAWRWHLSKIWGLRQDRPLCHQRLQAGPPGKGVTHPLSEADGNRATPTPSAWDKPRGPFRQRPGLQARAPPPPPAQPQLPETKWVTGGSFQLRGKNAMETYQVNTQQ